MSSLVGKTESSWQGYELGRAIPGGEVFEALAKLGYNANWILTGKGEMHIGKEKSRDEEFMSGDGTVSYKANNMLEALQAKPVVDAVMEVMTSDHSGVKLALTQNALMFQEMVRNANRIKKLEDRIEELERELRSRKAREDNFDKAEAQREK